MNDLSKEELLALLTVLKEENDDLEAENNKLAEIVIDATERIKNANDMAENYQRMFGELVSVIQDQYDAKFKVEDIPKRLS